MNSETELKPLRPNRLVGFDVIRFVSFWVISIYHFLYAVWRDRVPEFYSTMSHDKFFWDAIYPILRSLSFSGHTILFLTAILIAMAQKSARVTLKLCAYLVLAWLFFVWAEGDFSTFVPFWDIHPLIFVGLALTLFFSPKQTWRITIVIIVGFIMTWIPFWKIEFLHHLPLGLREILIGDCEYDVSSWPALPWLGFFLAGFALGEALSNLKFREKLQAMKKVEGLFWIVALCSSLYSIQAFYLIDNIQDWECNAFRIIGVDFWSPFIWVLFAIRLSLLSSTNSWLKTRVSFISRLQVSKNFFLVYVIQYIFGFVVAVVLGNFLRLHPLVFTLISLMTLPCAEVLTGLADKLGARKIFK